MLAVLLKGWDPPRTTQHFPRGARRVASDTPRADPAVWSRVMNYLYEITMADDSEEKMLLLAYLFRRKKQA